MVKTYHLHIQGIVQGVGFRPLVYRLARERGIKGWVRNGADGLQVHFQANSEQQAKAFVKSLIGQAPERAVISSHRLRAMREENSFTAFEIVHSSEKDGKGLLMITPDFAICHTCRKELYDPKNRRYHYPFITCTDCGPRYSIIRKLPYDRETTTMDAFKMCPDCLSEYENPENRRYHSQTNSCPNCPIELFLWQNGEVKKIERLTEIVHLWRDGKIIAVKGIGGYLLTCDATQAGVIKRLRNLKNRPMKPLALMYHDLYELAKDVEIGMDEKLELESVESPIVLLRLRQNPKTPVALEALAPGLSQLGVMMSYTPLYDLLLKEFGKPIVATSGNLSGSSIVYRDEEAFHKLSKISDAILFNHREIVLPQDDGVIRYSRLKRTPIRIRRSRGLAPAYLDGQISFPSKNLLATGALLKTTFAILHRSKLFLSQYLGNTDVFEAQQNYLHVLGYFESLLKTEFEAVVVDKHPAYFSTQLGRTLSKERGIPLYSLQHHKAHFYAVLAENKLLDTEEKVLGVIWDGTGLGDDGQVWGGEFFVYDAGKMHRLSYLPYFDFILGDKMPKEPRISALVLARQFEDAVPLLEKKFTPVEWKVYRQLLNGMQQLKTSSIGRLFDGIASLVLGKDIQTYEGEAAMLLEEAAYRYFKKCGVSKRLSYLHAEGFPLDFTRFITKAVLWDLRHRLEPELVAAKFHLTLADYISLFAEKHGFQKIAFSGGVFQNACLVDLVQLYLKDKQLYFHYRLSPNDENIAFGQICWLAQHLS